MKTLSMLKTKERFFDNDFFVFDLETTPFELNKKVEFRFGVIYGANKQKVIYDKTEFIREFEKPEYKKKKVFAHNAEFDLSVLYDNIYLMDKEAIFNGRFICANNGVCMFADSFNIFPTSVKEIGKMMSLEKQELSETFWTNQGITEKDIQYCIRDCEIVYLALLQIFELVGNIKITLAGLSLDLFRRKYQKFHIDYNEGLGNFFFQSYYGGRTEAFYIGKTKAVVYDINSMYPDAMLNCKFPNPKYLKHERIVSKEKFSYYLDNFEGCALLKINHRCTDYGFFPYRSCGKLLFPIGNFSGWWNFNEIRFALQNNAIEIKQVKEIIFAPALETPFSEFVTDNFKKRFETDQEFLSYLYKLFLNSLYGKFAQKIESEFIYIEDMSAPDCFELIEFYKQHNKLIKISLFNEHRNDCFLEVKTGNKSFSYNTIPLFSSYITSYARVKLLSNLIKYHKNKPVYCDTDSIFFEKDPKIKSEKELGKWKKEEKIVTEIRGLKNYDYVCVKEGEKVNVSKIKGIPKKAKKIDGHYEYETLIKTKESLRRNIETTTLVKREKTILSKYDKRNVLANGWTAPITL